MTMGIVWSVLPQATRPRFEVLSLARFFGEDRRGALSNAVEDGGQMASYLRLQPWNVRAAAVCGPQRAANNEWWWWQKASRGFFF